MGELPISPQVGVEHDPVGREVLGGPGGSSSGPEVPLNSTECGHTLQ